jgi:hypothetical protein
MEVDFQTQGTTLPQQQLNFQSLTIQQEQQQQQPQQSPTSFNPQQVLGLIVPGGPVRTDFVPVDNTGTKFSLTLTSPGDLPSPLTLVNELVCFLSTPLPNANVGLLIYWQLAYQNGEQSGFELLGALTSDRPSEVFRTGWSEHDQFLAIPPLQHQQQNGGVCITIGVSMEPIASVQNLMSSKTTDHSRRPLVAQKIAQDLYNFMQSFDTGSSTNSNNQPQQMVVPHNIFERWWKRFEAKSKRDPNFFLKNAD